MISEHFYRVELPNRHVDGNSPLPSNSELKVTLCGDPDPACCTVSFPWDMAGDDITIPANHACEEVTIPWPSVSSMRTRIMIELNGSTKTFSSARLRVYYDPSHWVACYNPWAEGNAGPKRANCVLEMEF